MIGETKVAVRRYQTKAGNWVNEYSDGPGHRDRPLPPQGEWLHHHEWRVGRNPMTGAIVHLTREQAAAVMGGWHPYAPGMGLLKARRAKAKAEKRRASKVRRFKARALAAVQWAAALTPPELLAAVVARAPGNRRERQAMARALRTVQRAQAPEASP